MAKERRAYAGAANDGISRIHRQNRVEPQATISPLALNGGVMEKSPKRELLLFFKYPHAVHAFGDLL
ncbi:MAG: hypothetical protein E7Z68_08170 [Thermoplasmata archaeon]|nr:hypothetical protein [Thermoplasmata archaeon]